jgi:hypothetical protein
MWGRGLGRGVGLGGDKRNLDKRTPKKMCMYGWSGLLFHAALTFSFRVPAPTLAVVEKHSVGSVNVGG